MMCIHISLQKEVMIIPFKTTPCRYVCRAMTLLVVSLFFYAFTTPTPLYAGVAAFLPAAHDTIPSGAARTKPAEADSVSAKKGVISLEAGNSLLITFGDDQAAVTNLPQSQSASDDKVLSKVEIESAYPGGLDAWAKYMNRKFSYPVDAQLREIQGIVIVQFIVDKEGNVSDVEAVSGPREGGLREEAVRVIRKSGKWMPAIQNGRPVKSYKKQPIIFRLS